MNYKDILVLMLIVFGTTTVTIGLQHWIPETISETLAVLIGVIVVGAACYLGSVKD